MLITKESFLSYAKHFLTAKELENLNGMLGESDNVDFDSAMEIFQEIELRKELKLDEITTSLMGVKIG